MNDNILLQYAKKWVALTADRSKVVASGNTMKEVIKKLQKIKDKHVIITYVLPFDSYYSPLCK